MDANTRNTGTRGSRDERSGIMHTQQRLLNTAYTNLSKTVLVTLSVIRGFILSGGRHSNTMTSGFPTVMPRHRTFLPTTLTLRYSIRHPRPPARRVDLQTVQSLTYLFFRVRFNHVSTGAGLVHYHAGTIGHRTGANKQSGLIGHGTTAIGPTSNSQRSLSTHRGTDRSIRVLLIRTPDFTIYLSVFRTSCCQARIYVLWDRRAIILKY